MADYHAILKRAISALPSPTGEARRAVYEKARTALVNQLKSFDPPLAASEITQQRLQLEDAIRKVESEAAKGLLRQPHITAPPAPAPRPPVPMPAAESAAPAADAPAPAPVAPAKKPEPPAPVVSAPVAPLPGSPVEMLAPGAPPPVTAPRAEPITTPTPPASPSGALKRAVDEAGALGGATAELGRQARDALAEGEEEAPVAAAFGREAQPPAKKAEKDKRAKRRKEAATGETPNSRLPVAVGVTVAILVVGIGIVALWSQREAISAFFGGSKAPVVDLAQRQSGEKLVPKSSDRLATDESGRAANPVKPVPTQTITPTPQLQSSMAPADGTGTETKPPVPTQAVPLVAQKAILYEEGKAGGGQAQISPGKVVWSVVPDPTDPKPGAMRLDARVEIPDRGFAMRLQMHPNADSSFPASHLIEMKFTLPADFDGKSVTNVPGLILKTTEQARGDPLVGAAAKVSDNFFWIALGAVDQDRSRNLRMIRERGWIDVPILYENGRRAILTLEKAGAGDQALGDALAAWGQGG